MGPKALKLFCRLSLRKIPDHGWCSQGSEETDCRNSGCETSGTRCSMFLPVTPDYTVNAGFSHLCGGVWGRAAFMSCFLRLLGVCDCSPQSQTSAFLRYAWLAANLMSSRLQRANEEQCLLLPAQRSYCSCANTRVLESQSPAFPRLTARSREQRYLCSAGEALCWLTLAFCCRTLSWGFFK